MLTVPQRTTTRPVFALLVFFALFGLGVGLWQMVFPASFFTDFPGFGWHWVDVDGPFNEHLLRDVGGGNLAAGAVALYALFRRRTGAVRAAGIAATVPAVPHLAYHLVHVLALPTVAERVAQSIALAVVALLAVALLVAAFRLPDDGGRA